MVVTRMCRVIFSLLERIKTRFSTIKWRHPFIALSFLIDVVKNEKLSKNTQ